MFLYEVEPRSFFDKDFDSSKGHFKVLFSRIVPVPPMFLLANSSINFTLLKNLSKYTLYGPNSSGSREASSVLELASRLRLS